MSFTCSKSRLKKTLTPNSTFTKLRRKESLISTAADKNMMMRSSSQFSSINGPVLTATTTSFYKRYRPGYLKESVMLVQPHNKLAEEQKQRKVFSSKSFQLQSGTNIDYKKNSFNCYENFKFTQNSPATILHRKQKSLQLESAERTEDKPVYLVYGKEEKKFSRTMRKFGKQIKGYASAQEFHSS